MQTIFSLLNFFPYVDWPYSPLWWVGWFALFALILLGAFLNREKGISGNRRWVWLVILGALAVSIFTSLFIGLKLPSENMMPVPGLPVESSAPVIMIFAFIPIVIAAGVAGPVGALIVAIFCGLLRALWETHSLFTILEISGLALVYSIWVRQRFRTPFYRFLRSPLGAAVLLSIVFAPVYILTAFLATYGSLAVRIDYALTQTWMLMLARGTELILAGAIGEVLYRLRITGWGRTEPLSPSPSERSLQTRFFYETVPVIVVLVLTLILSDWIVAGNAAENMIRDRLSSTARVASESLPYFLETGQNLTSQIVSEDLIDLPVAQLNEVLAERLRAVPYFRQLYVFNGFEAPVTGYPLQNVEQIRLTDEEKAGIKLALRGVPIQTYTVKPWPGENTAQVSFLAAILDEDGTTRGVLLARTDLNSNPFTQPAIEALSSVQDTGGEGIILDENQRILYHSVPNLVMENYSGMIPDSENFYSDTSRTGTRNLVYYRNVIGRPWAVVLSVPAEQAQQLALNIAVPLLIILFPLAIFAYSVVRLSLKSVAGSLGKLSQEAALIAEGQLDHPMQISGVDEMGRFALAFEQMRLSLKARLEELKKLLMVSQGVAANLNAEKSIQPVLDAAGNGQAAAIRVVLTGEASLDANRTSWLSYGSGPLCEEYSYLDGQLFELMKTQDSLTITNTGRIRRLEFPANGPQPGTILAWALRHENTYNGVFWIGYEQSRTLSDEEISYLKTLAGQATLAAANARLYATAEIGRQRLEAVLASTPEPVFVVDEQNRLFLLNPAAVQAPGLMTNPLPGRLIKETIVHAELLELVMSSEEAGIKSKEVTLSNNRIYYASISPVVAEGALVGKVCILRDITHYKQLDTLKSDFVATVSHDLRSPLMLMRGYATMLQMVGELNDQQKGYVSKIVTGVENMSRLVNNLLDLGRIEAGIGLKIEKVSANQIIDRVVMTLMPQAHQKNLQMTSEHGVADGQQVELDADAALLEQAVSNLVENAIKYTPMTGKVAVRLMIKQFSIVFEICDTGIGIAPLDQPHVFEKFYRSGRREAYQQKGTGLGLAIVKSIAERHHGTVQVESRLGKGSTFSMEIPFQQTGKED